MIKRIINKYHILKIIITVTLFVFLLLFSEILYALSNKSLSNIFTYYYLSQIKKQINKVDCEKAVNNIFKLTDITIRYRYLINPGIIPKNYSVFSILSVKDICNKSLINFDFHQINLFNKYEILDINLSYIYYILSINAYNLGIKEVVPKLLQVAIYLNPDLSFYHVELSNYYFSIGQKTKSIDQINLCITQEFPRNHCQNFLSNLLNSYEYKPVGFQKSQIDGYFFEKGYFFENKL